MYTDGPTVHGNLWRIYNLLKFISSHYIVCLAIVVKLYMYTCPQKVPQTCCYCQCTCHKVRTGAVTSLDIGNVSLLSVYN